MSLNFAVISPHPPIVIPEVGSDEDLEKVSSTILAMKKMANIFREAEIETMIVISPHSLIYPDRFSICGMKKLFGSFASFGAPDTVLEYQNDLELAEKIDSDANKNDIKSLLYDNDGEFYELDHGIMVPLYYISQQQETSLRIIPIAYSALDRAQHFAFGQVIRDIVKNFPQRVGIIASGDLSHRLIQGAPAGYSKGGKDFDQRIVEDLKKSNVEEIMLYDEEFVEEAGECGYHSILILLGALDGMNAKPEVLSYEGPFGVGYLVANYKLPEA